MLVVALVVLSFLAVATPVPGGTPQPEEGGIPPIVWELVELTGDNGPPVDIEEPSRYTVQFQPDGAISIKADCNQATASYTLEDGILEITPGISTLALCPPDSQADPFQMLLHSAERFEFDAEGNLILIAPEGQLRFRPALVGVAWQWHDFRGGDDAVVTPDSSSMYTLTFFTGGRLAVRADCNRAKGTYTVDGATIELVISGVTRAKCPPGSLMDPYLRDLEAVSSLVFRDGGLFLALPMDAGIMAFDAHYVAPTEATPEAG